MIFRSYSQDIPIIFPYNGIIERRSRGVNFSTGRALRLNPRIIHNRDSYLRFSEPYIWI